LAVDGRTISRWLNYTRFFRPLRRATGVLGIDNFWNFSGKKDFGNLMQQWKCRVGTLAYDAKSASVQPKRGPFTHLLYMAAALRHADMRKVHNA